MKYIYVLLTAFLLQSCYTLKPDSSALSQKDKNEKQEISSPVFVKKRNPIGVTFNIVTPLAAGAAMYEFVDPIVKYQDGAETKGYKPANAVIGVLGMMTINKIVDYSMGLNKTVNPTDVSIKKWMDKTDLSKNYSYIYGNNNQLMIIPKSKVENYRIKNVTDLNEYSQFFKNASDSNLEKIIKESTLNLEHEDLDRLITLYPNHYAINETKIKYISSARNYIEFWQRKNKYSSTNVNAEYISSELVATANDFVDFVSKFPSSPELNKVKVYSFKNAYSSVDINNKSIQDYDIFDLNETTFNQYAKANNNITEHYFDAMFNYKKIRKLKDVAYFYTEKEWLTKKVSANNKLEKAWQTGYNEYANGDDLVYLINTLDDYNWNISQSQITSFVNEKLNTIVKEQVKVVNYQLKRSTNDDLERFRKTSLGFAPFLVVSDGNINYLVYGEAINSSKFSVPVKLYSKSNVKLIQEGAGAVIKKVITEGKIFGETSVSRGIAENSFYFGYIRPNEKLNFALFYEFPGRMEGGIDILGMQYVEKLKLDNTTFEFSLNNTPLNSNLINKQNAWLQFIHSDFEKIKMFDGLRNISYAESQDIKDQKFEQFKEDIKRAIEEERRNRPMREAQEKQKQELKKQQDKIKKQKMGREEFMSELELVEIKNSSWQDECPCHIYKGKSGFWGRPDWYVFKDKNNKWYYHGSYSFWDSKPYNTLESLIDYILGYDKD